MLLQRIYMVDSKGLVTTSRGDELPEHKKLMARSDKETPNMKELSKIVAHVKPHALIGLTGGGPAWGKVRHLSLGNRCEGVSRWGSLISEQACAGRVRCLCSQQHSACAVLTGCVQAGCPGRVPCGPAWMPVSASAASLGVGHGAQVRFMGLACIKAAEVLAVSLHGGPPFSWRHIRGDSVTGCKKDSWGQIK